MKANSCRVLPSSISEIVLKSSEPVVPYIIEIPNNKIPDEKAEDKIILSAASDEILFSKSKLQSAANGIVESSSPK